MRPVSRIEVVVAVSALVVLMVVAVYGIIQIVWLRAPALSNVCLSHACLAYADRLLMSINKSVNPCKDFTRFVCDGWQRKHNLDVWEDQFGNLLTELDRHLKSVEWRVTGQNEEQRAAAVYRSCVAVLEGDRDELPAVKAALIKAGIVWPQPSAGADALHTLLYTSLRLGWDALLHFAIDDTEELVVSAGRSLHFVIFKPWSSETSNEVYFEFLRSSFGREGAPAIDYKDMSSIAEAAFTELSAIGQPIQGRRFPADWFRSSPVAGLTEDRWLNALAAFNLNLTMGLSFWTMSPEYLRILLKIWEKNGEDNFHLFVSWCVVQVAALYTSRPLVMNYYDRYPEKAHVYHKAFCVSRATFFSTQATFERYNGVVLQGGADIVARHLTLAVRSAFNRRLSGWSYYDENITVVRNWTSLNTAFRSFDKTHSQDFSLAQVPDMTESFVGNWQNSVLVNNTEAVVEIVQSLCSLWYYIMLREEDDFQLMPYSLSFPLFDIRLPAALNYGGLGWEVAGAIGNLFIDSYNYANKSQDLTNCIAPADSEEDVEYYAAYASGYGAVVDAFKSRGSSLSPAMPSLEEYSSLQLLFIASCYHMCPGKEKGSQPLCNTLVQHVPEFSEAFHCAPGNPMNRSYQCPMP